MTAFVLFGGKGGVGKTTLAAAAGLRTAREGRRTLVVSTDPAHSIGDAFDRSVGDSPTRVADDVDLYALEIDPRKRFRERYGDAFSALLEDARSVGIDVTESEVSEVAERGLVPGADEVAVLDLFAEYADDPDWDVVVFDTAPTGHTLRLLSLPDVMNSTVGKLLTLRNQLGSLLGSVGTLLGRNAEDSPSYTARMSELEEMTARVSGRLRNPERTEFRAVTLPERMALAETERLLAELAEGNIHVEQVLVNQLLQKPTPDCETCMSRHEQQQAVLREIRDSVGPSVREIPLVTGDDGFARIEALAEHVEPARPGVDQPVDHNAGG